MTPIESRRIFRSRDAWHEKVEQHVIGKKYVRVDDILINVLEVPTGQHNNKSSLRVRNILTTLGWESTRERVSEGGGVPIRIRVWKPSKKCQEDMARELEEIREANKPKLKSKPSPQEESTVTKDQKAQSSEELMILICDCESPRTSS